jgi:Na+(H+)/acetate symporter ActP
LIDRETTMSRFTRTLIIGATLTAMHLAGMTAVAQAQATDQQATPRPPTERQVGEAWRHRQAASQDQTAADTALQRVQARERFAIPNATPAQTPAPVPPEPSGQPNWLVASLGGFAAGLALASGLAMLAARRAGRSARVGHAA